MYFFLGSISTRRLCNLRQNSQLLWLMQILPWKNETFGHDKPFKRSYFTCTQKDKQTRKLFNFKIYFISTTSNTKPLAYKISNWITILKSLKSYSFLSDDLYIRNEITKCTFFSPLDCTIYNVIHWNFSFIEHIFIIYVAL